MKQTLSTIALLCIAVFVFAQDSTGTGTTTTTHWSIPMVASILIGFYEVLVRAIPTINNYSILNYVISLLHWASENLNNTKKQ